MMMGMVGGIGLMVVVDVVVDDIVVVVVVDAVAVDVAAVDGAERKVFGPQWVWIGANQYFDGTCALMWRTMG